MGRGFCLSCTAEILGTYGGWNRPATAQADISPERISACFTHNYAETPSHFERFYSSPYTTVETFLEVLYYVVVATDALFQTSPHRRAYLACRDEMQRGLYALLSELFGLSRSRCKEIDDALFNRSRMYAPDLVAGILEFGYVMQNYVRSDPEIFAKAAHAYILIAFAETFQIMLLYEKMSDGLWATTCSKCDASVHVLKVEAASTITCKSCGATFNIGQVYA